ncbi:TPA: DEAD/DEAH box helicase family protein [Pseudomonas aeruginosa]|uniref:DEAD/DEAH box helicase family protein n=1 Tax=Pseudomonas aeruginosa TaxID=287 RepID=UPI00106D13C8|nr:DEAD/DEAH box helicase family protein [Pseudomonas aeruginosa]HCG1308454.1 DEAD/DEAH box helicase family protein [Pseudomonas aeruginosa]HDQ4759352.1 DEAD/DEAH box helicase family protein [Pseudomonas aeruginosa]HEB0654486.1 DEAD/DEAH box helicase family protein [Pseudomonas aeruginosa]
MARAPRKGKAQPPLVASHFQEALVLNQYLISLFGIDPLVTHKDGTNSVRPLEIIAKSLRGATAGIDKNGKHHFLTALLSHLPPHAALTPAELERYDANLVAHTRTINARRKHKGEIAWKYFQWLTLLFVEIYLDRYFNDRQGLCVALNAFIERFNQHHLTQGRETGIGAYAVEDLNKLCLQNATGSGKTLLMHVNLLQFAQHARATGQADDYSRVIVLSPNERLSEQHERELRENGFYPEPLRQESDLISRGQNALDVPLLTEITKLADEQKVKQMAVDSFGDANLLLVDEGHRGMSGSDWKSKRDKLAAKGFTFEYSATFKQAVKAANDRALAESYAKAVLFDYSYRYFYADGYGKDYRIFNLPKDELAHKDTYLTAALLAFYQQLRMYTEAGKRYAGYNLEKPLWVFVGASVSGRKVDEESVSPSDVAQILDFLARFLARREAFTTLINTVLNGNSQQTGLLDAQGRDIFIQSFPYLKSLKQSAAQLYADICQRLFHAPGGGHLVVERVKGDSGELLLKVGEAEQPFGVINVGDAAALAKHVQSELEDKHSLAEVRPSEFGEPVFADVHKPTSPIHMLVGSKKFIEGWDCWRVSSLGLMRMGQSEGAQIIQLFGRGVRLQGKDISLMRTSRYQPVNPPQDIHFLETLNVFGVQADFMATFRDFLESEGLPPNDAPHVEEIKLNVTHDFGQKLKILRSKFRKDTQEQYDFRKHGPIVDLSIDALPPGMTKGAMPLVVDRFPRLQMLQATEVTGQTPEAMANPPRHFDNLRLSMLDWDRLWFDLERFRRQRHLDNVIIKAGALRSLLEIPDWYRILVPAHWWTPSMANLRHWQSIALELLCGALERCFNHQKRKYLDPRMELVLLTREHENLPGDDASYQLIVEATEQYLIDDIRKLKDELVQVGWRDSGYIQGLRLDAHLYEPLLSSEKVKIQPVALNKSEFQFVDDLRQWLQANEANLAERGERIFLLRNLARKGVGFFEAGNFYPDFILWCLKSDGSQRICFIDPHGLEHEGPGSDKVQLAQNIKDLEARLNDPEVRLESAILSPSTNRMRIEHLWSQHSLGAPNLSDLHVFFIGEDSYMDMVLDLILN